MAGGSFYTPNLFQSQRVPRVSQPLDPFLLSSSSSFLGSRSMMSFEGVNGGVKSSFYCPFDEDEYGDEELDEYLLQPAKKRRLSGVQVQSLERHFELDNKLEPERKVELAKDLGLQPRQVAIWFQNRRARWKTKQLEKDYGLLQASYDSLKADFDNLVKEHDQLKSQVNLLADKLLLKETDTTNNLLKQLPEIPTVDSEEVSKSSFVACKPEDVSSSRSNTLDSDGCHSSPLVDHSSQGHSDSDDNLSNSLLPQYIFPKLEEADYSDPPMNPCSYGFPVEDNVFWSWSY